MQSKVRGNGDVVEAGQLKYGRLQVALWQATIVENVLKRLAALNRPFKYVGTVANLLILAWSNALFAPLYSFLFLQ